MENSVLKIEQIIGKMLYHQHRCESHERDQEPGRGILAEMFFTISLVTELTKRVSKADFGWYRDFVFGPVGLHRQSRV